MREHYTQNKENIFAQHKEDGAVNDACSLCGGTENTVLYEHEPVRIVICDTCSLVFLNPRLSKEGYRILYGSHFQEGRRSLDTVNDAVVRLERRDSYGRKMKSYGEFFRTYLTTGSKCLEIGGGWGTTGKIMKDLSGGSVTIVEPSKLGTKVAKDHYGLRVVRGDLDAFLETDVSSETFDLIFLEHVFEHLTDPNIFLDHAKRLLNKNGTLLMAMPNIRKPDERIELYFRLEHTFYYSPVTLRMMLHKHGFGVKEMVVRTHEMVVAATPDDAVHVETFGNHEKKEIEKALARMKMKYELLRRAKGVVLDLLPDGIRERVHRMLSNFLRKIGVVKV